MPGLLDFLTDPDEIRKFGGSLRDTVNRGVIGGLLGAPVDIATMLGRPLGYNVEKPVGGSEWIGDKMQSAGMVSGNRNPVAETLASLLDPATTATAGMKLAALAKGATPMLGAMTAWHGSPHKFDKFSLDKIGTGEGAQAYGHGAYLAEAPAVAQQYQKTLAADGFLKGDGSVFDPSVLRHLNVKVSARSGDLDAAIAKAKQISASDSPVANLAAQDLATLEQIKATGGIRKNSGHLYKTDIPDEAVARFLDWDKPLSQQAPEVQKAIGVVPRDFAAEEAMFAKAQAMGVPPTSLPEYQRLAEQMDASKDLRHMSGGEWYRQTTKDMSGGAWKDPQDAASQWIKNELGIPGIRYLDGGLRSAGQGSSNFVAFDPEMIRILERNGQPTGLQPWQPGEYGKLRGLLGQ